MFIFGDAITLPNTYTNHISLTNAHKRIRQVPAAFSTGPFLDHSLLGVPTFPIWPSFSYSLSLAHIVVTFREPIHSPPPLVASLRVSIIHPPFMYRFARCAPTFIYSSCFFSHVFISLVLKTYVQVRKTVVGISSKFTAFTIRPLKFSPSSPLWCNRQGNTFRGP